MLTRKNAKAYAVLCIIFDMTSEELWRECIVEPYLNGRENGFAVSFRDEKVVFSENRNSDNIVVYTGKSYEFSMQGNGLTEEIYRNSKFFNYDRYLEAAEFCLKFLSLRE